MRYRVLVRDAAGKYRPGSPSEPGDVRVYVFSVRVSDLRQFGHDDLRAARGLLEKTQSVPSECLSRYRVVEIGRIEGGIRTISVECEK